MDKKINEPFNLEVFCNNEDKYTLMTTNGHEIIKNNYLIKGDDSILVKIKNNEWLEFDSTGHSNNEICLYMVSYQNNTEPKQLSEKEELNVVDYLTEINKIITKFGDENIAKFANPDKWKIANAINLIYKIDPSPTGFAKGIEDLCNIYGIDTKTDMHDYVLADIFIGIINNLIKEKEMHTCNK